MKATFFGRDVFLANTFSEGPEEVIATRDMCLVENTSIRGEKELEIEEETLYDPQAFIPNSRDQITEVESRKLGAEEQRNIPK